MISRMMLGTAVLAVAAFTSWQDVAAQTSGPEMSQDQLHIIQSRLAALGFDPGTRDGAWGEQTATALREFQQLHGIEASGEPTDMTLRMLGVSTSVEMAGRG